MTTPPPIEPSADTPTPTPMPYGSWPSPLTASSLTEASVALLEPQIDGDDIYWLEARPADAGRVTLVRRTPDGQTSDVTRAPYNLRSRVHEYGGGAYAVHDGTVVFVNFDDTRVYRTGASGTDPTPITPEGPLRFGDLAFAPDGRSVIAVCEDHTDDRPVAVVNRLVRLDLTGDNADGGQLLASGRDFYGAGRVSPDGRWVCWVEWDHPNMPWDSTELRVAAYAGGGPAGEPRVVAGGTGESVGQPVWAPDGRLIYVSDRTGFWNLYVTDVDAGAGADHVALWPSDYDFGDPAWVHGMSSYAVLADGRVVCSWIRDGFDKLGVVPIGQPGGGREIPGDWSTLGMIRASGETVVIGAGFPTSPLALLDLDVDTGETTVIQRGSEPRLDAAYVSVPEAVTWRNAEGLDVHGFYYPPRNPEATRPEGERPPLVVLSHGGPTGRTPAFYTEALQYWTTRGFAVLQVNYGGSSGFGRAYRERLRGRWGIVDIDDCASGALALAERGLVDPKRLAIKGGSAGGYTTLASLAFTDVFAAGVSYFGVGDLEALTRDTHKFESRYLDGLIGPYPEARHLYLERSPVQHVDQISCPMLLLQGDSDHVVPPNQATDMADAVRAKGLPVGLIVFEGEGHGFRRADSMIRACEAELSFYGKVFGFSPAGDIPEIEIANLPA